MVHAMENRLLIYKDKFSIPGWHETGIAFGGYG
jgi:hypothetical protein